MRGFKGNQKQYAENFKTYYNFIKPHSSIGGITPAEKAGIGLKTEGNKWMALLERSFKKEAVSCGT